MKPLLLPYIFNILVLIPVGLTTPFGREASRRLVFQGKLPEGAWRRDDIRNGAGAQRRSLIADGSERICVSSIPRKGRAGGK